MTVRGKKSSDVKYKGFSDYRRSGLKNCAAHGGPPEPGAHAMHGITGILVNPALPPSRLLLTGERAYERHWRVLRGGIYTVSCGN